MPERERRLLDSARDRGRRSSRGSRAGTPARRARCSSRPASRDPGTASRSDRGERRPARARACPGRRRHAPGERRRRGSAGRARTRRAAASTCPTPRARHSTTNSPSSIVSETSSQRRRWRARVACSVTRRSRARVMRDPPALGERQQRDDRDRGGQRDLRAAPAPSAQRRIGVEAHDPVASAVAASGDHRGGRCRERDVVARPRPPRTPPRAPGAAVAAHLERRGDVEGAVQRACRHRAHDGHRAAPAKRRGRQRRASARRAASRASTGTSRVASVAVSAERKPSTRRNSAQHPSGSTAAKYTANADDERQRSAARHEPVDRAPRA